MKEQELSLASLVQQQLQIKREQRELAKRYFDLQQEDRRVKRRYHELVEQYEATTQTIAELEKSAEQGEVIRIM